MTRRLERLLRIDTLIRGRERQTAGSLATELECSERTVRTELEFLRDRYEAPLLFTKSDGWRYTDPNWRLPSVPLTQGELFALTLGARMLEAYGGSAYEGTLRSAIQQLVNRLPEQSQVNLQQMADERVLFTPRATVALDQAVWQKLAFACQMNRQVRMRYFTAQRSQETERVVDPYVVYFSAGATPCMSGFCHNRQAVRDFRVDRIRDLELLTVEFERVVDFDAKAYLDLPFLHERGGEPMVVRIWFDAPTAPYIKERQWHGSQSIEEHDDGSVTLQVVAYGLAEMKRWVMHYGQGARVLEPPDLVAMVQEEVQGMYEQYQREVTRA